MIETWRGVVTPDQMDEMGHMNVRWYAAKYGDATMAMFTSMGLSSEYIACENKGMAALEQHVFYTREVFAGSELYICSQVTSVGEKVMHFRHVMMDAKDHVEVSECVFVAVCFDLKLRKSCVIPDEVRQKVQTLFDLPR